MAMGKLPSHRIPLLLRLKDVAALPSIEAAVTNVLVNELGLEINYRAFEALNKTGRFVLLLDGFEEIPGLFTERSVLEHFRELDKLVEPGWEGRFEL